MAYWKYINDLLVTLGVHGCSVFHPARYDPVKHLYWAPHFHFEGVVIPSYGRCRRCTNKVCRGKNKEYLRCDGFDALARKLNFESGFVVKVFGRRKKEWAEYDVDGEKVRVLTDRDNVAGTLRYELGHCGILVGSKRANAIRWFGLGAKKRMKITAERRKRLCPICDSELVQVRRLRDDAPRPKGHGICILPLFADDGESYYIEAFDRSCER